jgi:hypothetical protein
MELQLDPNITIAKSKEIIEQMLYPQKMADITIKRGKVKTEEDLRKELFQKLDTKEYIDNFEKQFGGPGPSVEKPTKVLHKNVLLYPVNENDKELLNSLLNDSKYTIQYFKDNWTAKGDYRVFVIYTEKVEDDKKGQDDAESF